MLINSCSSIDSAIDSTWDSVSEAGDYIYDSITFWEDDEPEQSEAVVIEEAVEVPEYAMPDPNYQIETQNFNQAPISGPQVGTNMYYDPIYRSARQYYYVGPNGTPMLAPPPPPFPQYSIDQSVQPTPYSYYNGLGSPPPINNIPTDSHSFPTVGATQSIEQLPEIIPNRMMSKEEEMELFGIQNNCIRVTEDLVNGGYQCDDFD